MLKGKPMTWDEVFDAVDVDLDRFPYLNDVQKKWCDSLTFDIGNINHYIKSFARKDDIPKVLMVRAHDLDNYLMTVFHIGWDDYYLAARLHAKSELGYVMKDWAEQGNSTALKVASIMAGLEEEEARDRRHVTIVIDTKKEKGTPEEGDEEQGANER